MTYTGQQIEDLHRNKQEAMSELDALQVRLLTESSKIGAVEKVREHLEHGAARRLTTLRHSLARVYAAFPPETTTPLARDAHLDVMSHLHAFLINLCGIFDNLAWAFVLRHGLFDRIGDRRRIGLFNPKTIRFVPLGLRDYLESEPIAGWQKNYLANYRDSLAHRIPPYVPPMQVVTHNADRWRQLWEDAGHAVRAQDWDRHDRLETERMRLESPCFVFALAFSETESRPVLFHAQMIADSRSAAAISQLFLDNWR